MNRIVAIIGLGYVGLPLAVAFLNNGFKVIGVDLDEVKLRLLKSGSSYINDVPDEAIQSSINRKAFVVTSDFSKLVVAEAIIICVPTPLSKEQIPDLTYLTRSADLICGYLRPGQLVILESSTYPGTTKEVLMPLLEKSGLTTGTELFIGFSPERVDPGNSDYALEDIPKVVSGITDSCLERTEELYGKVFREIVKVSSPDTAEMTKLLENTFRFINISFINEFAMLCDKMNINVWEVVEAARSKPFGFTAFFPGPGIGGHCIPVDPLYLQWKTKQIGITSSFIELASQINRQMPSYVISRMKEAMQKTTLFEARIIVLGITFKENVADIRESSSIGLIELLLREGAEVSYYDPYIPEVVIEGRLLQSVELDATLLSEADCILIATPHKELPLSLVVKSASFVFDTRNATRGFIGKAKITTLGGGKAGD